MKLLFIILSIILIAVIMFLFLPIKLTFVFTEKDSKLKVGKIIIFGRKKKNKEKRKKVKSKEDSDEIENKNVKSDLKSIVKKVKQLKEVYENEKDEVEIFLESLKNVLSLVYYRITASFGLDDPADTGMATGVIYSVISGVEAYFRNFVTPKKNSYITVTPDFVTPKFQINGEITVDLTLRKLFKLLRIGKNLYKRNKRKVKIILRGGSTYERSST